MAWYRYLQDIGIRSFWWYLSGYLAAVCLIIAGAIAVVWAWENIPRTLNAVGDLVERAMYPDVALAQQIARMDNAKISYLISQTTEMIVEPTAMLWRIGGVEMPEKWILSHLGVCNRSFPQLPAVRKQGSGTIEQLRQEAFIDFGVTKGWIAKREGQSAIWVNGWTPDKVLGELK